MSKPSKKQVWENLDKKFKRLKGIASAQTIFTTPLVFDGLMSIINTKIERCSSEGVSENEMSLASEELDELVSKLPNGGFIESARESVSKGIVRKNRRLAEEVHAQMAVLLVAANRTYANHAGLLLAQAHGTLMSHKVDMLRQASRDDLILSLYLQSLNLSSELAEYEKMFEKAGGKLLQERNLNPKQLNDGSIQQARLLANSLIERNRELYIKPNGQPNKSKIAKEVLTQLGLSVSLDTIKRNIF